MNKEKSAGKIDLLLYRREYKAAKKRGAYAPYGEYGDVGVAAPVSY